MGALRHLLAGPSPEERRTAGRIAGVLWMSSLPAVAIGQALPGTSDWVYALPLAGAGALWGLSALFLIPWMRAPSFAFHLPAVLSVPYIAGLVALTGQAHSAFAFAFVLVPVYGALFLSGPAIWACTVCSLLGIALPLIYDPQALDSELPAVTLLAAFVLPMVAAPVYIGKRRMLELRRREQEAARRDPLTGLLNRRGLVQALAADGDGHGDAVAVAVAMVDLDDFKRVNAAHGYAVGDRVLAATGDALLDLVPEDALVARLGGDEFLLAAPGVCPEAVAELADRAVTAIRIATGRVLADDEPVTASAGWTLVSHRSAEELDRLLPAADQALRRAKEAGKDAVRERAGVTGPLRAPSSPHSSAL